MILTSEEDALIESVRGETEVGPARIDGLLEIIDRLSAIIRSHTRSSATTAGPSATTAGVREETRELLARTLAGIGEQEDHEAEPIGRAHV